MSMRLGQLTRCVVGFLVLLSGCTSEAADLSEADVAAIRAVHEAFEAAAMAGDWDAALALYTEDAVQLAPEEPPALGRAAIVERWERIGIRGLTFLERDHPIQKVDGSGDVAYVWGTITQRATWEGQDNVIENGAEMLQLLRRQPDGSWLVALDIWHYHSEEDL